VRDVHVNSTLEAIEIFPWSENFATGIPLIDQQHRRLIDLLNGLVGRIAYQSDGAEVEEILEELRNYAVTHFRDEEAIWHKHFKDDAWEQWHRDAHSDFSTKISEMLAQASDRPAEHILDEIVTFLTHWLALHIIEGDKRLAKVVLSLPSGISLERAKELANLEMSGATRVLIDTVMSMYDKLANRTVHLSAEIQRRVKAEAKLEAMQKELIQAKDEAVAASRAKSSFLSTMSHEIRTPLNAVLGLAQIGCRETDDANARKYFEEMMDSGRLLLSTLNDVLDLAKIEAGKMLVAHNLVLTQRVAEQMRSVHGSHAREKGLILTLSAGSGFPECFVGDEFRICQVLSNLLDNAIKFTKHGYVTLDMAVRGDRLTFAVSDTGIGIGDEQRGRLFVPFEQAADNSPREFGGSGLGLSISHLLAELMNGNLRADSEIGVGSTFALEIPFVKVSAADALDRIQTHDLDRNKLGQQLIGWRVLVADDDAASRMIVERMLQIAGAMVECVPSGQQALDRLTADAGSEWDILVSDLRMPGLGGEELAERVWNSGLHLPVLFLTADALSSTKEMLESKPLAACLTKPVLIEELIHTIRLLSKSREAHPVDFITTTLSISGECESLQSFIETGQSTAEVLAPPISVPLVASEVDLIDWASVLKMVEGDREFAEQLIHTVLTSCADTSSNLRAAADRSDLNEIADLAHRIGGVVRNLFATNLIELSQETELAASAKMDVAYSLASQLAQEFDNFLLRLRAYRST
jgi:hemerythrin-like metal-binding protein